MSEEKQEEKKIVVDEDWKSQVAAEKQEQIQAAAVGPRG